MQVGRALDAARDKFAANFGALRARDTARAMAVAMRKVEDTAEAKSEQRGQLGGARADFVAALGRRVAELSTLLAELEADPKALLHHDELRRRVHALLAGAKLLRFTMLATELTAAEVRLDAAAERGGLGADDVVALRGALARLPALAWGHAAAADASAPIGGIELTPSPAPVVSSAPSEGFVLGASSGLAASELDAPQMVEPVTVLVLGPSVLADALTTGEIDGSVFEVERTESDERALDLARALAPDVIVVDADAPSAEALIESLARDPLTEPVPVVAVGRFSKPSDSAPFVALGVARMLPKPASPGALHRACGEVAARFVRREAPREPIGRVTLDELGARLAEELRRGLGDAALASGRMAQVDLGEGSDVLAALWSAVARVRDVVTIRSSGAVRFSPRGPEGALALASFESHPSPGRASPIAQARGAAPQRLDKIEIVVADDDAAVTWFLAGVLRAAGAVVHEAHDGARALALAYERAPDLVITDVLMPELDGFAVCRALKRDVAMRDAPVILLSWKEDLLQRVRELGGGADGYLRKETSAAVVVQRVREVLRPRTRIAERLAGAGEVRGRLDGLTPRTLLHLVSTHRASSTLTVRDAAFLYEIELDRGRPTRATRTAPDGTFQRGAGVLAALLGVGSGRFVVSEPHATRALRPELSGTLAEQLLPALARARAAQRLLSGSALMRITRVAVDLDQLAIYLDATPAPARQLLLAVVDGASPRDLIASGEASARLIEDLLCDAAARGAIDAIVDADGSELLAPATARETLTLRGISAPRVVPPPMPLSLGAEEGPYAEVDPAELSPYGLPTSDDGDHRAECANIDDDALPPSDENGAIRTPAPIVHAASSSSPIAPFVLPASKTPTPRPARALPTPAKPPAQMDDAPGSRRNTPRPSPYAPAAAPKAPSRTSVSTWALLAIAGVAFAAAARWTQSSPPQAIAQTPAAQAATPQAAATEPRILATAPTSAVAAPAAAPAPSTVGPGAEDLPLGAGDEVASDQGLLEVTAGPKDAIFVDQRPVGQGPTVKLPLTARREPYEVRVTLHGEERVRFVTVKQGRLARLRVLPPWSR